MDPVPFLPILDGCSDMRIKIDVWYGDFNVEICRYVLNEGMNALLPSHNTDVSFGNVSITPLISD